MRDERDAHHLAFVSCVMDLDLELDSDLDLDWDWIWNPTDKHVTNQWITQNRCDLTSMQTHALINSQPVNLRQLSPEAIVSSASV